MEAVLILLGTGVAAWAIVIFLRGGLLGGCVAVLLAGCCFGYPLFHWRTPVMPLTADRLLWAFLMGQYVVWRRLGWAEPKPLGRAEPVLALLLLVLAASTFSHDWQAQNALAVSRLAFYYLMPVGVYWAARQSRLSQRSVVAIWCFLVIFGAYLGITAVAEVAQAEPLVFPRYIMSAEHAEFLGRARGPLLNPVGNGILLGSGLAAGLVCWGSTGGVGRLVVTSALLLMALGLYLTLTRSVWLAAALGAALVLTLTTRPRYRRWVLATVLAVVACLGPTQWERLWGFKRDRALSAAETAESVRLRPILAAVAWKMFLDRPLWGCGFGQYAEASRQYLAERDTELPLEKARPFVQHNTFLALLTETGLVGMGLFAALLMLWVHDACRLWRNPEGPWWIRGQAAAFMAIAAIYATNGMFHDVSIIPMVNMFLFFMAGVTEGLYYTGTTARVLQRSDRCPQPEATRVAG